MEDNALGVERASEGKTVAKQTVPLLVTLTMVLPAQNVSRDLPFLTSLHVTIQTPVFTPDSAILLEFKPRPFVCAALHDHLPHASLFHHA